VTGSPREPDTVRIGYLDPIRVPFIGWLVGSTVPMATQASARQEFG